MLLDGAVATNNYSPADHDASRMRGKRSPRPSSARTLRSQWQECLITRETNGAMKGTPFSVPTRPSAEEWSHVARMLDQTSDESERR